VQISSSALYFENPQLTNARDHHAHASNSYHKEAEKQNNTLQKKYRQELISWKSAHS
jgi:hypothetical protein